MNFKTSFTFLFKTLFVWQPFEVEPLFLAVRRPGRREVLLFRQPGRRWINIGQRGVCPQFKTFLHNLKGKAFERSVLNCSHGPNTNRFLLLFLT